VDLPLHLIGEWYKGEELESLAKSLYRRAVVNLTDILAGFLENLNTLSEEQAQQLLSRKRIKTPMPSRAVLNLWETTYKALLMSFLLGMEHASGENYFAEGWYTKVAPIPFEEAISYFAAKIPMTKEEFYSLEKQLRFRAFTVARLTELDAINRVKEKLLDVIKEGKTFTEFWEEAGADGLLQAAGFHRSNPWYWETVFRTNIQSAYNAGRRLQISKDPGVKYLEFIGIRDSRQSEICRKRTGVIRPANDPWWKHNWPPLHFNCRSTVRAVYKEEAKALGLKPTPPGRLKDLPRPLHGFGMDPFVSESFWRLTPSMIERARKYGILGEIKNLAQFLGLNLENFIIKPDRPRTIKEAVEILNSLKQEYEIATKAPVSVKRGLLVYERNVVGQARYHTGEIGIHKNYYSELVRVFRTGVVETENQARAFHTLVHEFGHLVGEPIDMRRYVNNLGYRYLSQVVNDLWAWAEEERIAQKLGVSLKVRVIPPMYGYGRYINKAMSLMKEAGLTIDEIKELMRHLNVAEDPERFCIEIEKAMAKKLGVEEPPLHIFGRFGDALVYPEHYENFMEWIKRLKQNH